MIKIIIVFDTETEKAFICEMVLIKNLLFCSLCINYQRSREYHWSIRPKVFSKLTVQKHFAKLTEKNISWGSLFINVCWSRTSWQVFSCVFCKIFQIFQFCKWLFLISESLFLCLDHDIWSHVIATYFLSPGVDQGVELFSKLLLLIPQFKNPEKRRSCSLLPVSVKELTVLS